MSINLMDLLNSQVGAQLAGPAASFLGESESDVSKAMGGILPSILGGMMDKGKDAQGAGALLDMISGVDSGLMSNLGNVFGGSSQAGGISGLLTNGSNILGLLFGNNKLSHLIDLVGGMSGMKKSSSSSLLKLAAPFIMSFLGGKVKEMGLDALGLSKLLGSQKNHVANALPAGFGSALGIAGLGDSILDKAADEVREAKDAVASTVSRTANKIDRATAPKPGGNPLLKWLLPTLLALSAIWFFTKGGCNPAKDISDATEKVVETTKDAAGAVAETTGNIVDAAGALAGDALTLTGDALRGAFSAVDATAKAAWDKLELTAGSLGDQLRTFVNGNFDGDNRFTFNNLTFASGSAEIDAASAVEVDNLAQFLKAYTGVNVIVEGYTDNTGDAETNKNLSKARAEAVKARLVSQGISANRLFTEGYGSANPVASNDTAEGRAKNRRIELRIVK